MFREFLKIKLGHQVTVFAPMYGETQEEREAVLAADVSAPEQVVRYGTQKRKMDNGMVYPSFYPSEIMEAFERDEFDCIHVHHPMFVGPCALYLKRKYRLPYCSRQGRRAFSSGIRRLCPGRKQSRPRHRCPGQNS